jgi:hypothetical protein
MKYFKSLGLCLVAVFALGAVVASAAQAETNKGPLWIVGSPAKGLLTGETRAITSRTEAAPILHGSVASIECEKATNKGFLLGGSPGTADVEIKFIKCHVVGKVNCIATGLNPKGVEGEIPVNALIILGFPAGSNRTSAVAIFATESSSNLFSEFKLTGTECGILENQTISVKANGSSITIKGQGRLAGQIGEVGMLESEKFVLSTPGLTSAIGLLRFSNEEKPVKEAELYNIETGKEKYETIKAELTAGALLGEVHEVASVEVEIPTLEPFGWNY